MIKAALIYLYPTFKHCSDTLNSSSSVLVCMHDQAEALLREYFELFCLCY